MPYIKSFLSFKKIKVYTSTLALFLYQYLSLNTFVRKMLLNPIGEENGDHQNGGRQYLSLNLDDQLKSIGLFIH